MQKKRYYPPAEEQQGQQQNPISTPNPTGVLQTNPNNVANVTQFNPVQQQTPFGQTGVTSPFPQPMQNNAYPQSYDQTQAHPVTTGPPTLDGPTYGSVAPPPFSPTQSHSNVVTKHKHVFALDPEGSYSPDQMAQGFGQMNLGNQQQNTPMHPGQSAQHQSQQQQNFSTEPGSDPSTVLPQQQCPLIYQRMSLNSVPDSSNLLNKCSIPFGAVIHPMAEATNPEDRIPVVNFGVSGIVRCRRCRGYINPFVTFVDGGRRWRCNLCTLPNDVPSDYYSPLDRNGKRSDLNERPELVRGCVEYIAPSEYMVRPPQPPTYVFLLDVSYYSITSGMFHTAIKTIQSLLPHFPGDSRTRVAFITFDNTVHFYNLKASLSQPQMLVVTDIQDVFLPLPDDLLVNLQESKQVIETLLNKLPTMFQSTQVVDSVLGVALKAGYALAKNIGGKLITFSSVLPTLGTGKLVNREDLKLLGTDKETQLLLPDVTFYKEFALDCSRQQITVDFFAFSSQYCDLATLGCMPQFTGGQLYYYPSFKYDRDGERFARDLWRNVTRETGWEGVIRVRASKGLKVTAYYGNFFIRSTDLLALPSIDSDKAFAVQFAHSDSNIGTKYATFQTALLYTTSGGERRIRVFTTCLGVTNSMAEVFKTADIEATTAIIAKMAIEKALSSKLADAREALVNKTIDILSVYRSDVVPPNAASTQLSLPESLKLLPLYVMALGKNIVLRGTADVRPDDRSYVMMLARYLPYGLLLNYIYPRFYSLHNLAPEVGTQDERGVTVLPPQLNLSSEKLERNGVFLLEDGQTIYLYFGREAAPELVNAILGIPSLEGLDTTQIVLPLLDNEYSRRINNIVGYIRSQRATYQPLYVIREGEPRELKFFAHLVEDKTKNVQSYYEFLISIHQKVQAKLKR